MIKEWPAISVTGIAMMIPYNNTSPILALSSFAITTGPDVVVRNHELLIML